jgi:uncharacterized protein YjgD (DUF1641 family)
MAKPIPLQLPPRDSREDLRSRLQSAPLEHAEALLAGYQVLQGLHDSGALELLRGLLGSGDKVLQNVVEAARTPESVRVIRNLVILTSMLAEIDPDVFEGIVVALPEAMHRAKDEGKDPPGILATLNGFRSKELRRGMVAVNRLLEAWDREFFSDSHPHSKNGHT